MGRHCALCNIEDEDFTRHRESEEHRLNYLKYWFRTNQEELVKDKENVKVSCLNIGNCIPKVELAIPIHVEKTIIFCIEVQGDEALFTMYHFLNNMECSTELSDELEVFLGKACIRIIDDRKYFVELRIKSDSVGVFVGAIAFQFMHDKDSKNFFHIVRVIEVKCQDQVTIDSEPVEPYGRKRRFVNIPVADLIVRGRGLDKLSGKLFRLKKVIQLPEIVIPKDVKRVMSILELNEITVRIPKELVHIGTILRNLVSKDLHYTNYAALFKSLLQFEKIQMDIDIRKYDMKNIEMNSSDQGLLALEVPGLAENRPSVLRGDRIYVRIVDEYERHIDIEYEGFVHRVESTKVILGFGKDLILKHIKGTKYRVRFTYNLLPMKHMMLALDKVSRRTEMEAVLFPSHETAAQCILVQDPSFPFTFFNRHMEENEEQKLAVKQIVLGSSLPAPYLLFGPPGTGKTMTVTEAIKQVWKLFPSARILVCTPSNSASDLITERLLDHIDSKDIIRFYSASRPWEKVPQKLKDNNCTNYDAFRKSYFYPSKTEIMEFKVVISTLVNSGRLVLAEFPKNHFTHIIIDESGHSVEPEALIPISGLLHRKDITSEELGGQLVLAGDPKQLGPTIRSNIAEKNGLASSILKRLMDKCEVYQKLENSNHYNDSVLTKLVKNYRSHPDILHLPNLLFYDGELKVCADQLERESLCHWEWLPKEGFPLIFHGVFGKDQREGKSPSYFNPQEVSVVIEYVQKLLNSRKYGIRVKAKDIGVITPYRQQVYKIKAQLRKMNLQDVSAGSVDEFQGQERKAIIISTVRSNTQLMALDTEYRLGFIQHPERFNVAVTRAKSLLIVVGNPKVLSKDFHWRCLLHFCIEKGSYTGVRYLMPRDEAAEIVERFARLSLEPDNDEGHYSVPLISQKAQQEDPQWRAEL